MNCEDFKGLIAELNYLCFRAGTEEFAREHGFEGLTIGELKRQSPEVVQDFYRDINTAFKNAQSLIIQRRLEWEAARQAGVKDFAPPYSFEFAINLVTDYADAIAWSMLELDRSWVRSQFADVHPHSDLEHHNWKSIEGVISDFNSDPDQFALANDLTSFMHVGDVFVRNTRTNQTACYEVKEGEENRKVHEVLSTDDPAELERRKGEYIAAAENPEHSRKQVERNLKQRRRMARSLAYRESGGTFRTELTSGDPVISEEYGDVESWLEVAVGLGNEVSGDFDAKSAVVDGCLFVEYGRGGHTRAREDWFRHRISQHLGPGTTESEVAQLRVFDIGRQFATPGFMPRSVSFLPFGEENQARLLALEDHILVHLNIPALQQFLTSNDVLMTVRNVRQQDRRVSDLLMRHVLGNNKVARVASDQLGDEFSFVIGSGLFGRMLFEFMAPRSLVGMANRKPAVPEGLRHPPGSRP